MKYLLPLVFLVFAGCTKPCSQVEVVSAGSSLLSTYWECQNPQALEKWVDGLASSVGVCKPELSFQFKKKSMKGIFGTLVCPLLVEELRKMGASQVPAEAMCNPAKVGSGAATALGLACNAIPF